MAVECIERSVVMALLVARLASFGMVISALVHRRVIDNSHDRQARGMFASKCQTGGLN